MKNLKNSLLILLTLIFTVCMALTAAAGTITINNPEADETYEAYKIFDVTKNDNGDYAYTIKNTDPWFSDVQAWIDSNTNSGIDCGIRVVQSEIDGLYYIEDTGGDSQTYNKYNTFQNYVSKFANYLYTKTAGKTPDGTSGAVTAGTTSVVINNIEAGYYFVTTSVGTVCVLDTAAYELTLDNKINTASLTKRVDKNHATLGEDVIFTITVTKDAGAGDDYIIHDLMEDGLSLTGNGSFTVTHNKNDGAGNITKVPVENNATNYVIDITNAGTPPTEFTGKLSSYGADGRNKHQYYTVTLKKDFLATLGATDTIDISYTAHLNETAIENNEYSIMEYNHAILQVADKFSGLSEAIVNSYSTAIIKIDGRYSVNNTILQGARFKLFTDEACTKEVELVAVTDDTATPKTYYRPALTDEEKAAWITQAEYEADKSKTPGYIDAGYITLAGFNGSHYIKEFEAPTGYNPLKQPQQMNLTGNKEAILNADGTYKSGGIPIKNTTGMELPATGGRGAAIFYISGGFLALGALALLVTKRRTNRS